MLWHLFIFCEPSEGKILHIFGYPKLLKFMARQKQEYHEKEKSPCQINPLISLWREVAVREI